MRIGLIGSGRIGSRRAAAVSEFSGTTLALVADIVQERAEALARKHGCEATTDWRRVVERRDVDAVIVSTVNKFLAPVTIAAMEHGKHVLCEKPLGRNPNEARRMVESAQAQKVVLKTGFNHRHHPAIQRAYELCATGAIGPLYFVRCLYGHGGRPGYEKEWRGDQDLAGGGELLDQGAHVVDLCRWFLGDLVEAFGCTATCFWDLGYFSTASDGERSVVGRRLEDNAFAIFRTGSGQIASLHTSWTQWKNRFTFEVFGRDGYVAVEGLGGSYGPEQLVVGRRRGDHGPPDEERLMFPDPDRSWNDEWAEFVTAIREGREPLGNGHDGLEALRLVYAVYESTSTGHVVQMKNFEGK